MTQLNFLSIEWKFVVYKDYHCWQGIFFGFTDHFAVFICSSRNVLV